MTAWVELLLFFGRGVEKVLFLKFFFSLLMSSSSLFLLLVIFKFFSFPADPLELSLFYSHQIFSSYFIYFSLEFSSPFCMISP